MTETPENPAISIGMAKSKVKKLEAKVEELTPTPKTPSEMNIEGIKASYRLLLTLLISMGVTYLYQKYPVLGQLQPDQTVIVGVLVALLIAYSDQIFYQLKRNAGKAGGGSGLELPLRAFSSLLPVKKEEKSSGK